VIGTAAVVAHFDPENRLDPSFQVVLACLRKLCERIVLVTTCDLPESEIPTDASIVTIRRPNFGYDFYSYRVGLDAISQLGGCEKLFVVNSSFLVTNRNLFQTCLERMIERLSVASIVAVTESFQGGWHLQSYLLLLRRDALCSEWFLRWVEALQPQNTKFDTIVAGELGLSKAVLQGKIAASVIFTDTLRNNCLSRLKWGRWLLEHQGLFALLSASPLRVLKGFNPVHFAAEALARQCGLLKAELVRNNPLGIDTDWVVSATAPVEREAVQRHVERSKGHFELANDGLTGLAYQATALPRCRLIYSAQPARPGVHIAVVAHIFYPELIDEICSVLKNIIEPFDLFVTTPYEGAISKIFDRFSLYAATIVISVTENRGRDIGPFLALHRRRLLDPYEAILKLHSKRSNYSEKGGHWRQILFRELCGDATTVQTSLRLLRRSQVGIVGPHDYYLSHESFWGGNRQRARILLMAASGATNTSPVQLGFFAGSMFWYRPAALASLHSIPEALLAFEAESGQQDATLAHVFERIFCEVARRSGFIATSVVLGGENIDDTPTDTNFVPVLSVPTNLED
jgi:lipopolysaccharide biosynthesis protein